MRVIELSGADTRNATAELVRLLRAGDDNIVTPTRVVLLEAALSCSSKVSAAVAVGDEVFASAALRRH
jgi:hypothetical protein